MCTYLEGTIFTKEMSHCHQNKNNVLPPPPPSPSPHNNLHSPLLFELFTPNVSSSLPILVFSFDSSITPLFLASSLFNTFNTGIDTSTRYKYFSDFRDIFFFFSFVPGGYIY